MANQPKTPTHTVRVPDAAWDLAVAIAKRRQESVSARVIRPAIERYIRRHGTAEELAALEEEQ